jgi:hypothetical protein
VIGETQDRAGDRPDVRIANEPQFDRWPGARKHKDSRDQHHPDGNGNLWLGKFHARKIPDRLSTGKPGRNEGTGLFISSHGDFHARPGRRAQ